MLIEKGNHLEKALRLLSALISIGMTSLLYLFRSAGIDIDISSVHLQLVFAESNSLLWIEQFFEALQTTVRSFLTTADIYSRFSSMTENSDTYRTRYQRVYVYTDEVGYQSMTMYCCALTSS